MNHKVGDKVRIRDSKWIDAHKRMSIAGEVVECGKESMVDDMFEYAGRTATIEAITPFDEYEIDLDMGEWSWNDYMLEDGGELP